MVDKSSLRSNKPDSSSTSSNGEVPLPKSNSTSNSQGKAAPTRTTSAGRGKGPAAKKGPANTTAKDIGEEGSPQTNGIDSDDTIENKVNGIASDVEMGNDPPEKTGDEEMTVVVPPSKGSKLSGEPGDTGQEDVAMDNTEDAQADGSGTKVDPVAKAVAGEFDKVCNVTSRGDGEGLVLLGLIYANDNLIPRYQGQFPFARASGSTIRCAVLSTGTSIDTDYPEKTHRRYYYSSP